VRKAILPYIPMTKKTDSIYILHTQYNWINDYKN
jgi:hypothetical protein